MTEPERHALAVLAECPNGATADALATNCGIERTTLDAMVARGLIRTRLATYANPRGLQVRWFYSLCPEVSHHGP